MQARQDPSNLNKTEIFQYEKARRKQREIVHSADQYSQIIRLFDMSTSCYKTFSDPRRNNFIT